MEKGQQQVKRKMKNFRFLRTFPSAPGGGVAGHTEGVVREQFRIHPDVGSTALHHRLKNGADVGRSFRFDRSTGKFDLHEVVPPGQNHA